MTYGTPYIDNGKWKIFDKTPAEQTEADRILFDGFFNAIKRNFEFLQNEQCTTTLLKSALDEETKKTSQSLNYTQTQTKKQLIKLIYHLALKFTTKK